MENDKYIDSLLKQASNNKETEIPLSLNNKIKDTINNLPNKIVKHRRKKYIAIALILILTIPSTAVILTKPAFAEEIHMVNAIYEKLGYYKEYKEYSSYIGETKEYKGYKVTIDDLEMTKNKLIASVKITSDKPFKNDDKETSIAHNVLLNVDFKEMNVKSASGSQNIKYVDDNTAMIVYEINIYGADFKKRDDLKLMLRSVDPNLEQISADFNLKVDFTKAFDDSSTIKVGKMIKVGNGSIYIKELQATPLGTEIKYSINNIEDNEFALQVDDKIYLYFSNGQDDDGCHATIELLNHNIIKNAKSISVIPIYKYGEEKNMVNREFEIEENMKLPVKTNFFDEINGEIYKIERINDKIRVYYDFEDNTLGELSTMILSSRDQSSTKMTIGKDSGRKNGYYIEREASKSKEYSLFRFKKDGLFKAGEAIKIK